MDLEVINKGQERMLKINPVLGNGYSYESMKDASWHIDDCLKSAFKSLNALGLYYDGMDYLPLYESLLALTRSHATNSTKRSLEVTHTNAFPVLCKLRYICPVTGEQRRYMKTTQVTYIDRGNIFINKDSKFIVSPKLGDRVISLDKGNLFISISRSRMVFYRTPYMFRMDGRVVNIDIHRAKLYYDGTARKQAQPNLNNIPTLVNYLLAEKGLTGMFKEYYGVDVEYVLEEDFNPDEYPSDQYTVFSSNGFTKGRNLFKSRVVMIFKNEQFNKDLMHVIGATYFILDNRLNCPVMVISRLDDPESWRRSLAYWALDEPNLIAAIEKIDSHIKSVKGYIDINTRQRFLKENVVINDIYDLFKHVIKNFSIIAATHDVASMENKVLSVVPHFLFRLTSSIFKMMFELEKQAQKKPLSIPQLEKLLSRLWKEEAALSGIVQESNVRSLDSATDVMLFKATRIITPQQKRGPGSSSMSEMQDRAFAFHWSKIGVTSPQFVNKSFPTAIDSINHFAVLTKDGVLKPHPEALPVIRNIRELTEIRSTLKTKE